MDNNRFSQTTFNEWAGHPLTALLRAYLKDFQADLASQWASGQVMASEAQQTAKILGEISDLQWPDVARFYGLETEPPAE